MNLRVILRLLLWPFRLLRLLSKNLLILLFVGAILLNVAALTSGAVFGALSSLVASTGIATVQARQGARTAALGKDVDLLRKEKSALVRQTGNLKRANETLVAANRKVIAANKTLVASGQETLARQRALVSRTTARISRRTLHGSMRNIAAMAGEATPVFGIGVIIATTVWEIYDACETLKDVHALGVAFDPNSADPSERDTVCALQVPTLEDLRGKSEQAEADVKVE